MTLDDLREQWAALDPWARERVVHELSRQANRYYKKAIEVINAEPFNSYDREGDALVRIYRQGEMACRVGARVLLQLQRERGAS